MNQAQKVQVHIPIPEYNKVVEEIIGENPAFEVKRVSESIIDNYYSIEADESVMTDLLGTIGSKINMLKVVQDIINKSK